MNILRKIFIPELRWLYVFMTALASLAMLSPQWVCMRCAFIILAGCFLINARYLTEFKFKLPFIHVELEFFTYNNCRPWYSRVVLLQISWNSMKKYKADRRGKYVKTDEHAFYVQAIEIGTLYFSWGSYRSWYDGPLFAFNMSPLFHYSNIDPLQKISKRYEHHYNG